MQTAQTAIATVRFGTGAAPGQPMANNRQTLMDQLRAEDPGPGRDYTDLAARAKLLEDQSESRKEIRKNAKNAKALAQDITDRFRATLHQDNLRLIGRSVDSPAGFRERLAWFWTDHFTVAADGRRRTLLAYDFVETAIRPYIAKPFAEMLKAVVRHPAMLVYLNQVRSVGPNSRMGQKRNRGLNENLAREVLELHTVGVGGSYVQRDVREFAELLTGMSLEDGLFRFRPGIAEPGAETVLGRAYGGKGQASVEDVDRALEDLALHPDTAQHLARKLIVHFVGPDPAEDYVKAVADAYLQGDGRLTSAYHTLLDDPRAWALPLVNAKTPQHFLVSTLRSVGVTSADLATLKRGEFGRGILAPLAAMGQPILRPLGPDGWPEDPANWITPAGLAARVEWANRVVQQRGKDLDPAAFLEQTLGVLAPPRLKELTARAETRHEGVTLVLASPTFNRR